MFLFFCKQKTAYDMRIRAGSSDVCSSDLGRKQAARAVPDCVKKGCGRGIGLPIVAHRNAHAVRETESGHIYSIGGGVSAPSCFDASVDAAAIIARSEERRVGKGGVSTVWSRGSPIHSKKHKTSLRE